MKSIPIYPPPPPPPTPSSSYPICVDFHGLSLCKHIWLNRPPRCSRLSFLFSCLFLCVFWSLFESFVSFFSLFVSFSGLFLVLCSFDVFSPLILSTYKISNQTNCVPCPFSTLHTGSFHSGQTDRQQTAQAYWNSLDFQICFSRFLPRKFRNTSCSVLFSLKLRRIRFNSKKKTLYD